MGDIVITVAICLTQLALGIMGVHVSLRPPARENYRGWIASFVAVGLLGIGLTAWLAHRSRASSDALMAQIVDLKQLQSKQSLDMGAIKSWTDKSLRHAHLSFAEPHQIKTDPLLPFHVGQEPAVDAAFFCSGPVSARDSRVGGIVVMQDAKTGLQAISDLRSRIDVPATGGGDCDATAGQRRTFFGRKLTKKDVAQINSTPSKKFICIAAVVAWTDDTGDYEKTLHECFWRQSDGNFQWHIGPDSGKETKLR